jgi:DNA-binding FadR family transcriptional regulator
VALPAAPVRFDRIHQLRAHEYVAEQIRRHIALRLIPPGESLPSERELAAMFGVGRPTVQHALRLLEADHLVAARRGRGGGTFVSEPARDELAMEELIARLARDRDEVAEVLVYRRTVEPRVARLAAETRTDADLARMRRAAHGMATAETEAEYMRHDTEFHLAVAGATRNRFLVAAVEQTRLRLNDAMVLLPESDLWHRRIAGEHEAVLAALEAGDAAAATAAMDLHVANAEQGLRAVLAAVRARRGWDPSDEGGQTA